MHEPNGIPRVDLNVIKDRLKLVLREQVNQYWEYLRRFLQAKLSKKEFDYYARAVLGEENIPLHNLFIRSLLSNARCAIPPVLTPSLRIRNKKPPAPSKELLSSTNALHNNSQQSSTSSKKNSKPSKKLGSATATTQKPTTQRGGVPKGKPTSGLKQRPIVKEVPLGPEHAVLRQRMQRIATEAGLAGLTHDSIRVMMTAVETYIKRVVHASKPVYRPHPLMPTNTNPPLPYCAPTSYTPTFSSRPSLQQVLSLSSNPSTPLPPSTPSTSPSSVSPSSTQQANPLSVSGITAKFNTVTLQDLHKAAFLHPSLFGEDFLVNQERVSIALM